MKQRVVLGLSGGVDSAVAAYLLKQQGYEVIGVFMRNWDSLVNNDVMGNPTINDDVCPQEVDYEDAKKVAEHLEIEFRRVDFVKEYWDNVFTYFIDAFKNGLTPNPDILCNKYIKFKAFLEYAQSLNADYIATGHYARVVHEKNRSLLLKGLDNNKDQSYFLCQLNQQQLQRTLFPLGKISKPEVREIAQRLNLPVASKKDSTGICFIGERNFKAFLQNYIPALPGDVVDLTNNNIVGTHEGIMYHTIGQRKGLNIGGPGDAWFVVGKNYQSNQLYVAQGADNQFLFSTRALITDVNWIVEPTKKELAAKMRYRQPDNEVLVTIQQNNTALVEFVKPIKAVTPGQACVFYDGDICLGGGTITDVFDDNGKKSYV